MRVRNGLPYAAVAAVAVGAVIAGAAIAAQRGPKTQETDAAPLPGTSISTTDAVRTPTRPPSTAATTSPTAPSGETLQLNLDKLPTGREPQYAYLQGRKVMGGAGSDITIPGEGDIFAVARHGNNALALISLGDSTELVEVGVTNKIGWSARTPPRPQPRETQRRREARCPAAVRCISSATASRDD
jgi:hypothetical protein